MRRERSHDGGRWLPVAALYGVQGLGYTAVVTSLPEVQVRWGLTDVLTSVLLLGVCLAAAGGSLLSDRVAVAAGSRAAALVALGLQVVALLGLALAPTLPVALVCVTLYGVGLGSLDAAAAMQGVLLERRRGRPLLGRLFAVLTAVSVLAALAVAATQRVGLPAAWPQALAACAAATVAVLGSRALDPARSTPLAPSAPSAPAGGSTGPGTQVAQVTPAAQAAPVARPALPGRRIAAVGALLGVAFVVDSAVTTWSTIYLATGMDVAAGAAPLGVAAYQAGVLVARLSVDTLERRVGAVRVAAVAAVLGAAGCATVAAVPLLGGAVVGFGVAGLASGALVPLAFSAAGRLVPARSDEVVARVNLFNYAGVLAGAVALGLVSSGPGLGTAFVLPAVALLLALPTLRVLRAVRAA